MSIYNVSGTIINSAYNLSEEIETAYDVSGNIVFTSEPRTDYDSYTVTTLFSYPQGNMQGFAVYNDKIAQVKEYNNGYLHIIDLATGTLLKEVTMDTGHGNSCQFSNEFYETGDEFPLFYIRNSGGVGVFRIVGTGSTLIRKYIFSADDVGTYVSGFCIDDDARLFYTASYTEGDHLTKTGLLRICKWDMDDVTDNGDGTYSMTLLDSNDFEFFNVYNAVQGCCYHDGYFFIACGYVNTTQYVILVDIDTLEIAHSLPITPNKELEGCAWVENGNYLLIGQATDIYSYRKVEFAEV